MAIQGSGRRTQRYSAPCPESNLASDALDKVPDRDTPRRLVETFEAPNPLPEFARDPDKARDPPVTRDDCDGWQLQCH